MIKFSNLRGNLRKTQYDESPKATTPEPQASSSGVAVQLKKVEKNEPGKKRESQDDATPEFIRAKNNLRKTMYDDEVGSAPASSSNKSGLQTRARSLTDVHKPVEEKKKKGNFFSNLFNKLLKRKNSDIASHSDSDVPQDKGKGKAKEEKPKEATPKKSEDQVKQPVGAR